MILEQLGRHIRNYEETVDFLSLKRFWFKEILGDAYVDYDIHFGEFLKLLKIRMEGLCQSLEK